MKRARATCFAVALALLVTGGVPRKAAKLNREGNRVFDAKEFAAADSLYDLAQTRFPGSPELAYNRGNALYQQGQFGDAAGHLRRAADSTDPVLRQKSLYNLGNALHDLGELQMAAQSYREALKLNPLDRDAKINFEKTMRELKERPQSQQQQQQQQQKSQQDQQGGQGGKGENDPDQQPRPEDQSQDSQAKDEQNQPQDGQQDPRQEGEEQRAQPSQPSEDEDSQVAAMDSMPVDGLTREEAIRILEAMREQEKELQKQKARQMKVKARRVDKDW